VLRALNAELGDRVDPVQLAVADAVLRAAIADEQGRQRTERLVRPPPGALRPARSRTRRDPE
jgi:hypothetical protein